MASLKRYDFQHLEVIQVIAESEEDARLEANFLADLPPLDQNTLTLKNVSDA